MTVDVREIIRRKQAGATLTSEEIRFFVDGCAKHRIGDAQATALLSAIFFRGMTRAELWQWTLAMIDSGERLDFTELPQPKVDKHSTGGVGDKVSIALAPAVAACGVCVPMISGRGLGHTGGTLDKLESIPGLRTDLTVAEIHRALDGTGVAFAAQTKELVPADGRMYALRDEAGLVASIPLIASSIMSKKIAEGIDGLVLDVKFGSGAFLPDPARGRELAHAMLEIAADAGLATTVFLTAMDRPLGRAVGHVLEIEECIECLAGGGPDDLRELVLAFGGEMLRLAGRADASEAGARLIAAAIDEGRALGVFECVIAAQGGDPRCVRDRSRLPRAPDVAPWKADRTGHVRVVDNREIGLAVLALGGGRATRTDAIDPAVGIVWRKRAGDPVQAGETLAEVHHRDGRGLPQAFDGLGRAVQITEPVVLTPLVLARIDS
jgi:pyrimidine-nucleoside phosphorylase